MQEKRQYVRTEFSGHVKLIHPGFGELLVEMRDLSDGGLFVLVGGELQLEVGDTLQLQSTDIDEAPVLSAQVVRIESGGIALKFVED